MKDQYNSPLNLMAKRLGIMNYDMSKNSKPGPNEKKINSILDPDIVGVENQAALLHYNGGFPQQSRMIFDKVRTLDRVVKYSYQGAHIKKLSDEEDIRPVECLINPNKVKLDYDDKVLSVRWEYEIGLGDVFEWCGTKTYWIVYLQDLTELAYFKGDIRKCSYSINIKGADGSIKTVYAALTGPKEENIKSIKYNGISQDIHNNTISFYVPKNEDTIYFFNRNKQNDGEVYNYFLTKSLLEEEDIAPLTAWRTEDADWLSSPGVIRVTASEVNRNEALVDLEDMVVKKDTSTVLKVEDVNSNDVEATIVGDTFIKPMMQYAYTYENDVANGVFSIEGKKPPVQIIEQDKNHIVFKWTAARSGQFDLVYTKTKLVNGKTTTVEKKKTIVVESLY